MQISVKSNIPEVVKHMRGVQKQIPYAVSRALNNIAYTTQQEFGQETKRKLDKPTPFTQKAWLYKKSTKTKLTAIIYAKEIQSRYLSLQEKGGTRRPGKKAVKAPVNLRTNQYGNIPRKKVQQLLADKRRYFSGKPQGMPHAPAGIWRRLGTTRNRQSPKIQIEIAWGSKAEYRKRTDFRGVVERVVRQKFASELRKQIAYAVKTAK